MGCKRIYNVKYKANESLEWYKARFIVKGYTQTYGVDYVKTLAPIAKMNMVKILLSLATKYNWDLQQLNVKKCISAGRLGRRNLHGSSSWI